MTPELSRRLGAALTTGEATVSQRQQIVAAAQGADNFEELPEEIRRLVEQLESA